MIVVVEAAGEEWAWSHLLSQGLECFSQASGGALPGGLEQLLSQGGD